MKGVVFTEFLELVENRFGLSVVDKIIRESNTSNDGAYTAVGTYDHRELLGLVAQLQKEIGLPIQFLVKTFGKYLLHRLAAGFPQLFAHAHSLEDFLATVESVIHVEVKKLYPDAELPSLQFVRLGPGRFTMEYHSKRPFADLAEGLLVGAAEHYGETIEIAREALPGEPHTAARFTIICVPKVEPCLTSKC